MTIDTKRRIPVIVDGETKPITRGDCERVARPCRWSDCRYHMPTACVLDLATEHGGMKLEAISEHFGTSREAIRLVEKKALTKLWVRLAALER